MQDDLCVTYVVLVYLAVLHQNGLREITFLYCSTVVEQRVVCLLLQAKKYKRKYGMNVLVLEQKDSFRNE